MSFEYIDPLLEQILSDKDDARKRYQKVQERTKAYNPLEPATESLLRDWLAISIEFELQTPWFSKDDVPFHVLDNPVRRDRVLGIPMMSAASWKGLLCWACRMRTGMLQYLEANNNQLTGWRDAPETEYLFGTQRILDERERNESANDERRQKRGVLAFRPTWFDSVGFEVINPHDRTTKAGKAPILYEVVPPGAIGKLNLLYAPSPGQATRDRIDPGGALSLLFEALEALLVTYGFSAKHTSSWGIAVVKKASLRRRDGEELDGSLRELGIAAENWLGRVR